MSKFRVVACLLLAAAFCFPGLLKAQTWQERFVNWHKQNEFRCLGSANSANLCWWESYLLQSYLTMYAATEDTFWLNRLCVHADTMIALMRDAPDSGDFWPGYKDGFLGWGTTRYDPDGRYQEYMVHDAYICLPLARFCRLVDRPSGLSSPFGQRAQGYVSVIKNNVVAKWFENWNARRGDAENLAGYGGWNKLPYNQFLAFGELLLVLGDLSGSSVPGPVPVSFYSAVPDSMARFFSQGLLVNPGHKAYVWYHSPDAARATRYEDVSHANLDISFALEARQHDLVFGDSDLALLARALTETMWDGSETDPKFSRFVNGTGGYDDYTSLEDWLRLSDYDPELYRLVRQAYLAHPEWTEPSSTSSCRALVVANLAELDSRNTRPTLSGTLTGNRPGSPDPQLTVSPNPFRTHAAISLQLTADSPKVVRICDAMGRCVRSLPVPHSLLPVLYSLSWDGRDASGNPLPSGAYYCVLAGPGFRHTQLLTLLPGPR